MDDMKLIILDSLDSRFVLEPNEYHSLYSILHQVRGNKNH